MNSSYVLFLLRALCQKSKNYTKFHKIENDVTLIFLAHIVYIVQLRHHSDVIEILAVSTASSRYTKYTCYEIKW